jgi:hypothetical protein
MTRRAKPLKTLRLAKGDMVPAGPPLRGFSPASLTRGEGGGVD